ncbi:MAG: LysR family transcriptional regulator, partial [Pseudomonadota bacterium]
IRWGDGAWDDAKIIPLMQLSAWPVGNAEAADLVRDHGLAAAFRTFTLLRDHDGSHAWSDWLDVAGLPRQSRKDTLIIPDPNVRVQAVINGQGVALNDALVGQELNDGSLFRLSEIGLESYGYFLAVPRWASANPCVEMFADWVLDQQTTPVEF